MLSWSESVIELIHDVMMVKYCKHHKKFASNKHHKWHLYYICSESKLCFQDLKVWFNPCIMRGKRQYDLLFIFLDTITLFKHHELFRFYWFCRITSMYQTVPTLLFRKTYVRLHRTHNTLWQYRLTQSKSWNICA